MSRSIVCIVEGPGDADAVPRLINRWLRRRNVDRHFRAIEPAIKTGGKERITADVRPGRDDLGIENWIKKALKADRLAGVIVILDADEDCPAFLGPALLARARKVAPHVPLSVVVARKMLESWILADFSSLRARGVLGRTVHYKKRSAPEDCGKFHLEEVLGMPFKETIHLKQLADELSLRSGMHGRSPSYDKLSRDLERLLKEARAR